MLYVIVCYYAPDDIAIDVVELRDMMPARR